MFIGKSLKDVSRDKSPLPTNNTTIRDRFSLNKVNRCQSYRLGNRNHSNINISTEKTTEGSPFSRTTNNVAQHLQTFAKENVKKVTFSLNI